MSIAIVMGSAGLIGSETSKRFPAAQLSHEWAALDPHMDFEVNAGGTFNWPEAIELCEVITGPKLNGRPHEDKRIGGHIWWIRDVQEFQGRCPAWRYDYDLRAILQEIHTACRR